MADRGRRASAEAVRRCLMFSGSLALTLACMDASGRYSIGDRNNPSRHGSLFCQKPTHALNAKSILWDCLLDWVLTQCGRG